jgi:hypothetical protein
MWGVSNYFFLVGFGVVAPETCLESRCLKRKQFERMSQEELLLRHSRIRRKGAPRYVPNLIHHCDASLLGFILQFKNCRGDITGCDNILLVSDGRFDDCCMESIRDQANDQIVLCNFSIESFLICGIEGDRVSVLDSGRELLRTFEGSAR